MPSVPGAVETWMRSAVAALVIEHRGEVDRRRVAADADGVERAGRLRGGKNHETQHQRRKAPDQTQCQFSAINECPDEANARRERINDMKAKEIKGFPAALGSRVLNRQHNFANMFAGLHAPVRVGGLFQRECAVHQGFYPSLPQ